VNIESGTLPQLIEEISNILIIVRKSCDDPIRTEERHVFRLIDEAVHEGDVISNVLGAVFLVLFQGNTVY